MKSFNKESLFFFAHQKARKRPKKKLNRAEKRVAFQSPFERVESLLVFKVPAGAVWETFQLNAGFPRESGQRLFVVAMFR